jgi:hypothetical protein
MTTTEPTTISRTRPAVAFVSLDEQIAEAHIAMLDAWKVQSQTTADEGYTIAQAEVAIAQAVAAQEVYYWLLEVKAKLDAKPEQASYE